MFVNTSIFSMNSTRKTLNFGTIVLSGAALILCFSLTSCAYQHQDSIFGQYQNQMNSTALGATVGAVVGAGLGTIVGSTSGNAGEGLAIGAAVGALAGAAIGAGTDSSSEDLQGQREILNRQHEQIELQDREIQRIKQGFGDTAFFQIPAFNRSSIRGVNYAAKTSQNSYRKNTAPISTRPMLSGISSGISSGPIVNNTARANETSNRVYLSAANMPSKIQETNIIEDVRARMSEPFRQSRLATPSRRALLAPGSATDLVTGKTAVAKVVRKEPKKVVALKPQSKLLAKKPAKPPIQVAKVAKKVDKLRAPEPTKLLASGKKVFPSPIVEERVKEPVKEVAKAVSSEVNCPDAEKEASVARNATADADKLFYYRRALRLCKDEPAYHVEIGRVYSSIGRREEAQFEFSKALELDPDNRSAQDELTVLMLDGTY